MLKLEKMIKEQKNMYYLKNNLWPKSSLREKLSLLASGHSLNDVLNIPYEDKKES